MILAIKELEKQFKNAIGMRQSESIMPHYLKEFREWLAELETKNLVYCDFLAANDIDIFKETCAEIDKQELDSIAKVNGNTIITPFNEEFSEHVSDLIIPASLVVSGGKLSISTPSSSLLTKDKIQRFCNVSRIMTHNPYDFSKVSNWADYSNSQRGDVTLSVFGSVYAVSYTHLTLPTKA